MDELKEMHEIYKEQFSFNKELEILVLVDIIIENRSYYYLYPKKIYEYIKNYTFKERIVGLSEMYILSLYIINIIEIIKLKKDKKNKPQMNTKQKLTILEKLRNRISLNRDSDIEVVKSVSN